MPDYDLGKVEGEDGSDATVTVDSNLSSTSTNPVQNKVIKSALDGKQGISTLETAIKQIIYGSSYNTSAEAKFNYAIIKKTLSNVVYEELWILSNAYYDYTNNRFVKIDMDNTSFGIQIQANGTYPGEAELGYGGNTAISIWRNPKASEVVKDTTIYNYTDFDENHYIGAKRRSDNVWVEYGISSGWNNNFMTDSYGGMTIGGAGFEVDGNGLFPYIRVTHSKYTSGTSSYSITGILENAYHPSGTSWNCDNNNYGAWFFGLRTPIVNGAKDTANTDFVVMYNDMDNSSSSDIHNMNMGDWEVIFSAKSSSSVVDTVEDGNMHPVTSNAVYDAIGNIQEYVNR